MDYPASPQLQKTRASPNSAYTATTRSPPRHSAYSNTSTTTNTPSPSLPAIRYFTPLAESSKAYDSPYTKGEDLSSGRLTSQSSRQQSVSTGITPFIGLTSYFSAPKSISTMSSYSSSSHGSSSYSAPGPRQQKVAASMASSSRTASQSISAVSTHSISFSCSDLFYQFAHSYGQESYRRGRMMKHFL